MGTSIAKILIVDDTKENANLLERLVHRMMGHEATVAYSGADALKQLDAQRFDLVILDIIMPEMDGLAVLHEIRKRYDMQQLPVMLLSARANTKDITEGLKQGANDYITKPLTLSIIRVRIETQLQLKSLADERQRMMNTLQHANAAKTQLMRIASHDLKNPLHSLNLILALLEPEIATKTEVKNYMTMAHRHTATMEAIITDFLELDLLRDEVVQVERQPVPIGDVVHDVVHDYQTLTDKKDITVESNLAPGVVYGDPKRLKQVISNLMSNAVKYSSQGSTVRLNGTVAGESYVLHVLDEGDGIPMDRAEDLFKPFGKLGNQPTGSETSTGLGLWIARQLMDLQDGSVEHNPDYTDGADFWVRIPLAMEIQAAIPTSDEPTAGAGIGLGTGAGPDAGAAPVQV